jgi:hypothetical protein
MLRKLITATLGRVLEFASLVILLVTTVIGWNWPQIQNTGDVPIFTAAIGFVVGLLFVTIVFGVVFVLLDIEESSRETAQNMRRLVEALNPSVSNIAAHTVNIDENVARLGKAQVHSSSVHAVADELNRRQTH